MVGLTAVGSVWLMVVRLVDVMESLMDSFWVIWWVDSSEFRSVVSTVAMKVP